VAQLIIADDSMFQRFTSAKIAKDMGFEVLEASTGKQCIEHLQKHTPAGLLLDMNMPEVTGVEVLQFIKEQNIKTAVAVITADIQETTKERIITLGVQNILHKPVDENALKEFLSMLCA